MLFMIIRHDYILASSIACQMTLTDGDIDKLTPICYPLGRSVKVLNRQPGRRCPMHG